LSPLWKSVVSDHSDDRYGYHRLDGFDDERRAAITKKEVDSNPL
jgi:hypothetical protein